jgi:hypothetical protein
MLTEMMARDHGYDGVFFTSVTIGVLFHAREGRRALQLAHASIESFETGKRIATS